MVVPVGHATPRVARAPIRTCVGCRRASAKDRLVRVVERGGTVVWDRWAREPGRGAYLCPDRRCVAQAVRQAGAPLARALRVREGIVVEEAALVAAAESTAARDDHRRQE